MKLSSLCSDKNENVEYRQKSPEKTTSISVTQKLLQCVWCSTEKKNIGMKMFIEIFMKMFIEIFMKMFIEINIHENVH